MERIIKVLAIDEEEIILKSIRKALKSNDDTNFIITTCSTAVDGLKIIRSDTFDIVFIDLLLPGMNGIEVLRRIKNIYPEVPVIIMSGFSSVKTQSNKNGMENPVKTNLNNAESFLLKPFTTEELQSIITGILG